MWRCQSFPPQPPHGIHIKGFFPSFHSACHAPLFLHFPFWRCADEDGHKCSRRTLYAIWESAAVHKKEHFFICRTANVESFSNCYPI